MGVKVEKPGKKQTRQKCRQLAFAAFRFSGEHLFGKDFLPICSRLALVSGLFAI